jgi:hypothetical protein
MEGSLCGKFFNNRDPGSAHHHEICAVLEELGFAMKVEKYLPVAGGGSRYDGEGKGEHTGRLQYKPKTNPQYSLICK